MTKKDAHFELAGQFHNPDEPHPFPGRFENPQFINRENKGSPEGVDIVMNAHHGTIMVDFGRPIQTLGLHIHDAKVLTSGLMESILIAMVQAEAKSTEH